MSRKIVKEIPGLLEIEKAMLKKEDNASSYCSVKHDPWKPVYIVIENAHDFYGETCHGEYDTLEEAEKWLEIFCKENGGRIEQTTYGEIESVTF